MDDTGKRWTPERLADLATRIWLSRLKLRGEDRPDAAREDRASARFLAAYQGGESRAPAEVVAAMIGWDDCWPDGRPLREWGAGWGPDLSATGTALEEMAGWKP